MKNGAMSPRQQMAAAMEGLEESLGTPDVGALMVVQMRVWPASVFMTHTEAIDWAKAASPYQVERMHSVLSALRMPTGIFYRIPYAGGEWRGFRYGLEDHEYLSF